MGADQVETIFTPDSQTNETVSPVGVGEAGTDKDPAIWSMVAEQSPPPPLPTAEGKRFGVRAGAYIIDTVIINAASFAGGMAGVLMLSIVLAVAGRPLVPASTQQPQMLQGMLVGLALGILYFSIFEWLYGASPGKVILKLRVVREDGRRPGIGAALLRGLFRLVDGLLFGIPAALAMKGNPLRQRIGDRYAHTVVVGHRDPVIRQRRSWVWFAVASGLSLIVLSSGMTLLALENLRIAPPKTAMAATDLNLRLEDLEGEFTLEAEQGMGASPSAQLTDSSGRLFRKDQVLLLAIVSTFPFIPTDTVEEAMEAVKRDLAGQYGNQDFTFAPMRPLPVGERAGVIRFVQSSTGEEGYVLLAIRSNVLTRLTSYGAPGAMSEDELIRLVTIMDARIR
jgi:uncharacterized RDD family membrane protein YckC